VTAEGCSPFCRSRLGPPVLAETATAHGVRAAQVVLRRQFDHGPRLHLQVGAARAHRVQLRRRRLRARPGRAHPHRETGREEPMTAAARRARRATVASRAAAGRAMAAHRVHRSVQEPPLRTALDGDGTPAQAHVGGREAPAVRTGSERGGVDFSPRAVRPAGRRSPPAWLGQRRWPPPTRYASPRRTALLGRAHHRRSSTSTERSSCRRPTARRRPSRSWSASAGCSSTGPQGRVEAFDISVCPPVRSVPQCFADRQSRHRR